MSDTRASRTVTASDSTSRGTIGIGSLVLLAVLLAAGFILNMTAGNALAVTGIKPQFIIAAYALAIALTRADVKTSVVFGLVSAAVIQFTTSIPGLNFFTEVCGALAMCALVRLDLKVGKLSVTPLVGALLATLVSGVLFALIGTLIMGLAPAAALAKAPIVLGTAVFNAVVVQVLYLPLAKALKK